MFQLDVAGVAIATAVSHLLSAVLTTRKLRKLQGDFHLDFTRIRINRNKAGKILRLCLPTGVQNAIFSIANLMIQESVNALGTAVVAGNSAAQSMHLFAFMAMNAFSQGGMTFAGQNYGARKYGRLRKVFRSTLLCQLVLGIFIAALTLLAAPMLLRIYFPSAEDAVNAGVIALQAILLFGFLGGFQDCSSNILLSMNRSVLPMIVSIFGTCVLRIFWVLTVFQWAKPRFDTLAAFRWLMLSYPITWGITLLVNLIIYFRILKKLEKSRTEIA